MDNFTLTAPQKRWLALATAVALALGVVFLVPYLGLIIVSAIAAYMFNPLYQWLSQKLHKAGLSAMLTVIISLLALVIPLIIVVLLTIAQTQQLLSKIDSAETIKQFNTALPKLLDAVNNLLASLHVSFRVSTEQLAGVARHVLETLGKNVLSFLTSSLGGFVSFFTLLILYIFVFANILRHQTTIKTTIKKLNLLGDDLGSLYAQRIGAMTKATIRGQFVIALAQGFASAIGIYFAGVHGLFFFSLVLFTVLSIIPLGAGIVVIPIGVLMVLFGNIWAGLFLLAWHFLVTTNIDNILRPMLVPKSARLNSALMLLAVFAGLAHFGFLGIILGPVIMIVIVTTIQVYLSVYRQVDSATDAENPRHTSKFKRLWQWGKQLF
jgi:predicted PurR-regulated permease PerM